MIYYKQTKAVSWLPNLPEGTIWVSTFDDYIQPEDETLRMTPLGVDLSLLDDSSLSLFVPVQTLPLEAETKQLPVAVVGGPAYASVSEGEQLGNEGSGTVAARGQCEHECTGPWDCQCQDVIDAFYRGVERKSSEGQL